MWMNSDAKCEPGHLGAEVVRLDEPDVVAPGHLEDLLAEIRRLELSSLNPADSIGGVTDALAPAL